MFVRSVAHFHMKVNATWKWERRAFTVMIRGEIMLQIPLESQLIPDLYHMREVGPGDDSKWRGMEGKPRGLGTPWAQVWEGPQHVIFGHDSKRGLQVCPAIESSIASYD